MKDKLYFVGSLMEGSTTVQRLNALKKIFTCVYNLDQQVTSHKTVLLFDRLTRRLFHKTVNSIMLNKKIYSDIEKIKPEVFWLDKVTGIFPATLCKIKKKYSGIKIIHYSPDDMINPGNQTSYYRSCIPLYDLHVTTKSYNVQELYDEGAEKVLFVNNAYAPEVHKPYSLNTDEMKMYSSDVSFIGGREKERASTIYWLAENGIKITVWGLGWSKLLKKHPNILLKDGWYINEEYCRIICASKINLAFLRKANRDVQTTRTMEIPACGGFMLAERTDEHLRLFKEGSEAAYFSSNEELKDKIEYYLECENERKQVAAAGYKRCITSGYDNITMVTKVLESF